jgi:hypothetical protein
VAHLGPNLEVTSAGARWNYSSSNEQSTVTECGLSGIMKLMDSMPIVLPGTSPLSARDESEYSNRGKRTFAPYKKRPDAEALPPRKAHLVSLWEEQP